MQKYWKNNIKDYVCIRERQSSWHDPMEHRYKKVNIRYNLDQQYYVRTYKNNYNYKRFVRNKSKNLIL